MLKIIRSISLFIIIFVFIVGASQNAFSEISSPIINEIQSSNSSTIQDEEGDFSDWIEIFNPGDTSLNLEGYGLSDRADNPFKWVLPKVTLGAEEYLLVFASGKDRANVVNHYETVITQGDIWQYFVGVSEPPEDWNNVGFDDSVWESGPSGIGKTGNDDATVIPTTISYYIRRTFTVEDIGNIQAGFLHMDYDDAFVAYINGNEIARANIGEPGTPPTYNQLADVSTNAKMMSGLLPELFRVEDVIPLLVTGENVLAIQIHNFGNPFSDLSAIPFLTFGMTAPPLSAFGLDELFASSLVSNLHTNFKIAVTGETLTLTAPDGTVSDQVEETFISPDNSFGRLTDGAEEWVIFTQPTPGESNQVIDYVETDDVADFSYPGGLYSSGVMLELTAESPTAAIHYTTDGSDPSETSDVYSSSIAIDSTTVVRARIFDETNERGKIFTNTYVIRTDNTLPIVSISTNPDNLFDRDIGIYYQANINNDWERPVHVELYENDGRPAFSIDAGVKIVGGWARNLPQRSLAIYARDDYGTDTINYQLFPDKEIYEYKSFTLRNNGNDWWMTFILDGLCSTLALQLDIDTLSYRPAVLYINGEYWGIHNIRDRKNEDYMASHHPGVDADNVDIVETATNKTNGVPTASEGDTDHWVAMMDYVETHDLSVQENYDYVKTLIDMPSYLDFYVAGFCTGRCDWPGRNMKFWRPKTENGKWRFLFFDLDCSFGRTPRSTLEFSTFDLVGSTSGYDSGRNPPASTLLFRKLLENREFQLDFANHFADAANTVFSPDNVIGVMREIESILEDEYPLQFERWGDEMKSFSSESVQSVEDWHNRLDDIEDYAMKRQPFVYGHIMEKFGLSGTAVIELDILNHATGSIQINTVRPDVYPWTGTYFQDAPVKLTAVPAPGYRFAGWDGASPADSVSIMLSLTDDTIVTAMFEEDLDASKTIVINEINYNSSQYVDPEDWVELYNATGDAVDLSGWILKDENDAHEFVIPQNTILQSGNFLVLCADAARFSEVFPQVDNYMGELGFGLSGAGDMLRLFDAQGEIIDSVTYDNNLPWPVEPDGKGPTLSLIDPELDNANYSNWTKSIKYGSPGMSNDLFAVHVSTEDDLISGVFKIEQNYPNPFNPSTTLSFTIPAPGHVTVDVHSVIGQRVVRLKDEQMDAGHYSVVFNPDDLAGGLSAGIYFYTVRADELTETRAMLYVK